VSYTKLSPSQEELEPPVLAADGPESDERMLPGAFAQQSVGSVGGAPGINTNPKFWGESYQRLLYVHVEPGVLPARRYFERASHVWEF
jgi:hypothetical protein